MPAKDFHKKRRSTVAKKPDTANDCAEDRDRALNASDDVRNARRHSATRKNPDSTDGRTDAQKDRDRILYTSALRRLAKVTQVVATDVGHVFHNRLTHSLQVAQVGLRVAQRLSSSYAKLAGTTTGFDPDVVEAACLAHDLGHPPFGHVAEKKLDELAGEEIDGFEGNAQSFRIVTRLSQHSPIHRGLDLTRATLAAILKYPWLKDQNPAKPDKWGAYSSEKKDFDFATALCPCPKERTIEASLMDWADDITYSVHDVEDFYRAGRLPLHLLADRRYDKERKGFFEKAFARHSDKKGIWSDQKSLEEAFNEVIVGLFPLEGAYTGEWQERAALRDFTSQLIGRYVGATTIEIPNGVPQLHIDADRELEVAMLKELTWIYVIEAPELATQQEGQRQVIHGLFSIYWDAAQGKRSQHLFPPYYRKALESSTNDQERKRVVVDLIAGMTEEQALAMYTRLTGVSVGSGLEQIFS
jgi:dGTPase